MLQILTDNQLLMSSERFPKVNSSTLIKTRFHCFDCTDNKLLSDWAQFPSLHPFFLLSILPTTPALPDFYTLTWWNREQRRRGDHQAWLTMIASLGGKKPQKSVSKKTKMWTRAVTGLASVAWFDCTLGGRLGTGLHWEWWTVNTSPERLCNPTASNTDEPHSLILYLI